MTWPASVITRQISFGKAVILETGEDLKITVQTKASRSLVSLGGGFRMERLVAQYEASDVGSEVAFVLPVTNQTGWADADTRLALEVGADKHSHLYTTTLTIFKGSSKLKSYDIGPYPLPQGPGIVDGDTMLVTDSVSGVMVTIPQAWQTIISNANLVIANAGKPNGVALLDADGDVIDADGQKVIASGGGGTGGAVASVNGKTGTVVLAAADVGAVPTTRTVAGKPLSSNVTLAKGDVGLPNVDNTSDLNKPISNATQAALDGKKAASWKPAIADLPAGSVITAYGNVARPTSRTDVTVMWFHTSKPDAFIDGDVWNNI